MNVLNQGKYFRSRAYNVTLNGKVSVEMNFINPALTWDAADIVEWKFRLFGTVKGGGGGAALGRDAAKWFSQIRVTSRQPHVFASGATLRVNEQEEWGATSVDPADVASGVTNANYEYFLSIPYEHNKSSDDRDAVISAVGFMNNGGRVDVVFPSAEPTNWDPIASGVTSLQFELWAIVKEGRKKQVSSLLCIQEYSLTVNDDQISVDGLLRALTLTSQLVTTGYTSMAGLTALDSRTLEYEAATDPRLLKERYKRSHFAFAPADENLLATPGAIPWFFPDTGQKMSQLPLLTKCHIRLNAAVPTESRFLVSAYQDRNPNYSASAAGYEDVNAFLHDMKKYGVVRGLVEDIPVTQMDTRMVNKLPLQIKAGG